MPWICFILAASFCTGIVMKKLLLISSLLGLTLTANATTSSEMATDRYLSSIRKHPEKVAAFLYDMPKGGDLHNHASGSTFAENLLQYASKDNLCINRKTYVVSADQQCSPNNLLNTAVKDDGFRDQIIDAWSMQHFQNGRESGHDHFFNTFGKFGLIPHMHTGEILAEIAERAAEQNEFYVETMLGMDDHGADVLAEQVGWDPDLARLRDKLNAAGMDKVVASMSRYMDQAEAVKSKTLGCDTSNPQPGCRITMRYQQQVKRIGPPEKVFAELLAGFEAAAGKDPRLVSVNLVQPEDAKIAMRDYELHMQMVGFLHKTYPTVKVTLHAGELNSAVADNKGMSFHIHDAVEVAHSNRIGHGVDIANETGYTDLLNDMAAKHVMVEINLSSNMEILNVKGKDHPLPLYMQYGVPVALSTDDEGVTRDILSKEYQLAETWYQFSYPTLKYLSRNSLEYAFVEGDSLWQDSSYHQRNAACKTDRFTSTTLSSSCQQFLTANKKAALEWQLEKAFVKFEGRYQ